MSFSEPFSSHCLNLRWGDNVFNAISIKRTGSSATEVDITGMDSYITFDPESTDRAMMWKEVDTCITDPGEVAVDFWAISDQISNLPEGIGLKKLLVVGERDEFGVATGNNLISHQAILTQFEIGANIGEYVRGSVTFRLSGYKE